MDKVLASDNASMEVYAGILKSRQYSKNREIINLLLTAALIGKGIVKPEANANHHVPIRNKPRHSVLEDCYN